MRVESGHFSKRTGREIIDAESDTEFAKFIADQRRTYELTFKPNGLPCPDGETKPAPKELFA